MTGILFGAAALAGVVLGWEAPLVAATVAVLVLVMRGDRRTVGPWAALVVAVAVVGALRHPGPAPAVDPDWLDTASAFRGEVISAPARSARSQRFDVRLSAAETEGGWSPAAGTACVVARPGPAVGLGDQVWFAGDAASLRDEPLRVRGWLRSRGCVVTAFAAAVAVDAPGTGWRRAAADARDATSARLRAIAPGDAGVLMSGLVTGDDSAFSDRRDEAFRVTGTTHVTAVSGSNFATFVAVLVAAGALGGWRRSWPWLVAVAVVVWVYAVFTGLQPPGVRAAVVATLAVFAVAVGRRPDIVTLLALAGGAMALVDPGVVGRLAFGLSLAASLALATVASPEPGEARGIADWVGAALLATVVAQIATLPLLLPITRSLAPASLPANVAIAPLVAVAYPASLAAAAFAWTPIAEAVALPGRLACEAILWIVDRFAAFGVVRLGAVSGAAAALVLVACLAACVAVSRDGQRWWSQTMRRRLGGAGPVLLGAVVGVVAAAVMVATTR